MSSLSAAAFVSNLEVAMDNLHASSKRSLCVIAGDFNARNSLWWSGQDSNEAGLLLTNCAAAHGFVQTVEGPTRAVTEPAASQLDLMFVNDLSFVDSWLYRPSLTTAQQFSLSTCVALSNLVGDMKFWTSTAPTCVDCFCF